MIDNRDSLINLAKVDETISFEIQAEKHQQTEEYLFIGNNHEKKVVDNDK